MRFYVPSTGKFTKDIPDDKVAGFVANYPDAIPAEEGMTPTPQTPRAPAPAPAPTPTAAAPAEEGGFMDSLAALATGAGRGLTAEFLDEMRGTAAMLGAKYGSEGVAPEFLAQEDFYTQGREEEQARQRRLEEQSPFLTAAGQIGGAIAPALLTGGAAAAPTTLGARFAAAAPAAAGYSAATGVGRTDIIGTPATTEETAKELLQNVAVDTALGLGGAGLGAAAGQAASGVRGYVARKLAEFGSEADKLRVATAGPAALKAAEKGQGGVDVKEMARIMREPEVGMGGLKTPAALQARGEVVEEEAGSLIGRIVDEVDAASGGLLKKAEDARAKAALAAEQNDFILWEKLSKEAEQAEAAAASRRVSGDEVAKRLEAEADRILSSRNRPADKLVPIDKKNYDALLDAADRSRGLSLTLRQTQESLAPLARQAKFEKGAPDEKVVGGALAAREESRALREQMDVTAEEALPTMASTPTLEAPLARVGKGARLTEPPTGRTGYQSARRVYDVMQDIIPAAEQQAARIRSEYGMLNPRRYAESYLPGLQATGAELAQTMAPRAETVLLTPQERALRSLPYGAVAIEDMLRQIDEESAP